MSRLSQRPPNPVLALDDVFDHTDTSDTSQSGQGTSKRATGQAVADMVLPLVDHNNIQNNGSLAHAELDAQTPTVDEKAALTNAPTTPNAGNPFATVADLSAGGGGDVTGPASAVAGNVATYADTSGKIIADGAVPAAQIPTADQKSALDAANAPGAGNPFATIADTGGGGGGIGAGTTYVTDRLLVSENDTGGGETAQTPIALGNGQLLSRTAGNWAAVPLGVAGQVLVADGIGAPAFTTTQSSSYGLNTVANIHLSDVGTGTLKGRSSAGTGNPEDFTVSSLTNVVSPVGTENILAQNAGGQFVRIQVNNLPSGGGSGDMQSPASIAVGELYTAANTSGTQTAASGVQASDLALLGSANVFAENQSISRLGGAVYDLISPDNNTGIGFQPGTGTVDERRFFMGVGGGNIEFQAYTDAGSFVRTPLAAEFDGTVLANGIDVMHPDSTNVGPGTWNPAFDADEVPHRILNVDATIGAPSGGSGIIAGFALSGTNITVDGSILENSTDRDNSGDQAFVLERDAGGTTRLMWGPVVS